MNNIRDKLILIAVLLSIPFNISVVAFIVAMIYIALTKD